MKSKNSPVKKKLSPRQKSASTSRSKKPASIKPKQTKKLKAEILNVYNAGWEAYLKGDLKTHGFHLSNNFKIIGSSEAEQFNSKKSWLAYCKKTIKQFAGVIQLKNRKINLVPAGEDVMVVENADIYVLIDKKWSFYSRIRITALLQKEKTGWKYIHQHGSLPDARASEGEVIATAQIKKENLLLKEAVKRRTIELETKNQELEIEASLERVRTVAMAMRKPEDMLQICESLYTELQKLGFSELRNSMINVYDDVNASFLNYDFAGEAGSSTTFFKNDSHPVIENFIKQIRKTRDAFAPVSLGGSKLRDFIRFRESNGEKTDLKLRKASAIHYYFYSIGNGSIGISTLKTIPDEQVQTLKRFRNVFEIAYQRYTDISLAEEQAREAQIELALERVRARTMAMQKSEELAAVSEVLRKEMGALGVEELETSSIYIVNENETTECWYAIKDVRGKNKKLVNDHMTLRLDETWVGRQMKKFFYSKETRVSIVMKGENRKQWINYCAGKSSVLKGYYGGEIPARTYHLLKFSNGFMGAASPGKISVESWDLLQRATAVFSFAYKRFSDLQKAEAQTREAKIEAALERIRARALAMHRSEEFTEVAKVMREQMGYLGQPELETSAVHLYEEDANNIFSWRAFRLSSDLKSNISFGFFKIPKNSCAIAKRFVQKFKSKATDYTVEVSGAEQAEWYKILFKLAPEVHAAMRKSGTTKEKRYYHFSKFTGGALLMVTSKAPANDAIELQKRSALVFDLAYRRFKDLQQAEAQARESQIQLALERVRARTMAMQNSSELPAAANLLFQQMQELGMPAWSAGYCIWDEDLPASKANKQGITLWMSSEGVMQPSFHAPLTEDPSFIHMREAFERNQDFHVEEVGGKELVKHYRYMRTLPVVGKVLDSIIDAGHPLPVFQIFHCVYFSQGFLLFITYEPVPEAHDVFKRFGRVFDQTYTRFLDLQKAEAQAREAQIEAALERVRSQTMAMHNSEDVGKCIVKMFSELTSLGVDQGTRFGIGILNHHNENIQLWTARKDGEEVNMHIGSLDMNWHPLLKSARKAWKEQVALHEYVLEAEDLVNYYQMINHAPDYKLQVAIEKLPEREFHYGFVFEHGFFYALSPHEFQSELIHITKRFTSQFGQTYRRYLDLVRAEAQAREAQIEAALERVRSRSMAMHKSQELIQVVGGLDKEIQGLGIEINGSQIVTDFDNVEEGANSWVKVEGQDYLEKLHVPHLEHRIYKRVYDEYLKGVYFFTASYSKEEKNEFFKLLYNSTEFRSTPKERQDFVFSTPVWIRAVVISKNSILIFQRFFPKEFSDEEGDIFKRFGKVFEQAYVRFLDLQKAEAQAREAQIEAALERVRSRSIGMHKSEELKDVIKVVYNQLVHLNIKLDHAGFVVDYQPKADWHFWIADKQEIPSKITHPYFESVWATQFNKAKEKGEDFFVTSLNFEEKNKFYQELLSYIPGLPQASKDFYLTCPGLAATTVLFENISLYIENFSGTPYNEEENKILMRFGKVFQQTYTRFLDLQNAEAQAREAKIEAALERVRSRSMAMHKSEELPEVIQLVFEQLRQLNYQIDSAQFDVNFRESDDINIWTAVPGQPYPTRQHIPYFNNPVFNSVKHAKESGLTVSADNFTFEEKNQFFDYFFKHTNVPEERRKFVLSAPSWSRLVVYLDRTYLGIQNYSGIQYSEAEHAVLFRFAKVFEQTYTRFLDLQKAEAQAREAQIEAALERIRAKALAMQTSNDLLGVANVLREQMGRLGQPDLESSIVHLYNESPETIEVWYAYRPPNRSSGEIITDVAHPPKYSSEWAREVIENYQSDRTEYTIVASGEKIKEWYKVLEAFVPVVVEYDAHGQLVVPEILYYHFSKFSGGALLLISNQEPSTEARELQRRAAVVFDLAYTRFLDLQKAEAQAREAQVEASLERVRSKTMAMHNSEDVSSAIATLFTELDRQSIENVRCGIAIIDINKTMEVWSVTNVEEGKMVKAAGTFDMNAHKLWQLMYDDWRNKNGFLYYHLTGKEKQDYIDILNTAPGYLSQPLLELPDMHCHVYFFNEGAIWAYSLSPHTDQQQPVMKRFTSVFSQTYLRYRDLQRAEAQAREAQIEAALERVRAKTMAMHKSEQLPETAQVLFEQFGMLGKTPDRMSIGVYNEELGVSEWWVTDQQGIQITHQFNAPLQEPTHAKMFTAWKEGKESVIVELAGDELKAWVTFVRDMVKMPIDESRMKGRRVHHSAFFSQGQLLISAHEPMPHETLQLLVRFAKVFSQTYTRFLDLQKAEANAREANIETSLERLRSKTMAMHNSQEVGESVATLFDELVTLGVLGAQDRCGIGIMQPNEMMELWTAEKSTGKTEMTIGHLSMQHHTLLKNVYQNWLDKKETYQYILEGEDKLKYYEAMRNQANYKIRKDYYSSHERIVHTDFFFNEGCLYVFSQNEFSLESSKIFIRFAAVFGQTYRRYLDLQKAEAQALEAIKRASVDRVRAEIASMRTKQDLERITPLIWKELTTLGIPFVRCGVFIMDEKEELIHTFLSTPDGKAIAAFHVPYGSTPLAGAIEFWREKKIFLTHWGIKEYAEFADSFIDKNENEKRTHYLSSVPREGIHLHLLPFLQGMLYVGNTASLTEDNLRLVQSVADAFSTAYARYEDFNKIESAKAQVEKTLADLKQTQAQLVQSEKMASLGELTAGIAHEIQNPLNFVNNFSEVSNELIKEIQDIRHKTQDQANITEEDEILNDIASNLEKINHHGKRAADIVKGMLQHSRSSSGVKEATDINALADEYLRLAYHGLRAKDKSFNATMKTDFDVSIGNVNVIPQDIGRVILNLITNAFYAVNEKHKAESLPDRQAGSKLKAEREKYEPTVSVSTKKEGDNVLISVNDNGNGISQKILDKIFQPFFTTKPTGQGTGLGLSLSYDIVKAHGGELKVETKESAGSKFVISLPV